MTTYPPLEQAAPQIWTDDDMARWQEAIRLLAVENAILEKCERCKIPVAALREECDAACNMLQALINEYNGQNATHPVPLTT